MQPSTRPVTVTATKVMSGAMVIMDVLKPRFVAKDDVMVKGDNGANLADITAGDKVYCYGNQACYGATILAKRYVYGYGYKGLESAKVKALKCAFVLAMTQEKNAEISNYSPNKKLIVISTGLFCRTEQQYLLYRYRLPWCTVCLMAVMA